MSVVVFITIIVTIIISALEVSRRCAI